MFYSKEGGEDFVAYSDSDWGNCPFSVRSLTGYCVYMGGCLISWKTKKQKVTSKSSCEAELRSMSMTTSEIEWMTGLYRDLQQPLSKPVVLHCDSRSAEHIAHNEVFHERTKHLKIDCYYIRENIEKGTIQTAHVRTGLQIADILTKPLSKKQHYFLCSKLGLACMRQFQLEGGVKRM